MTSFPSKANYEAEQEKWLQTRFEMLSRKTLLYFADRDCESSLDVSQGQRVVEKHPPVLQRDQSLRNLKPAEDVFEQPPDVRLAVTPGVSAKDYLRVDPRRPPPECMFVRPSYSSKRVETRYEFQARETKWRDDMNFFLKETSFTHKDVKFWSDELKAFADDALDIARWKLAQMIRVTLYDPTLYLLYLSWRDTASGLMLLALELWDGETYDTWRICDNDTIFWLLGLLTTYNDASCVNISDCVQRWAENVRMWITRNYDHAYTNLVVHDARCQAIFENEALRMQITDLQKENKALKSVQALSRVSFKEISTTREAPTRSRSIGERKDNRPDKDRYTQWKNQRETTKAEDAKTRDSLKRSSQEEYYDKGKQQRRSRPTERRRDFEHDPGHEDFTNLYGQGVVHDIMETDEPERH
jgi:hypothetical protein